ncbi:MAG: TonB-dependent receptor [Gemmatimonadales bacterium]
MRLAMVGRTIGAVALAFGLGSARLAAQGVTSAAVQGVITREGGQPVEGANIVVINTTTGARQGVSSRANGRYNLENVPPGGPFTIEVRAIGFEMASKTGVMLALGQRYTADFEMKATIVTLQELVVAAVTNPLINAGRTGAAATTSDTMIQKLPVFNRNFTSLFNIAPQAVLTAGGGAIIGGQNNRFNNIQIDGGVNNDIFGLAASGTPGGQASSKPLSIEALQEFQVLVAPYDVRYGSFSGGLVNGITKSGTNKFTGSAFAYYQQEGLVGKDTAGAKLADFSVKQYGGTIGGPIVKDKAHFFVSGDFQSRLSPYSGFETSIASTGVTDATANRIRSISQTKYGFDPGGPENPDITRPDNNVFAKVDWQLNDSHLLEVSNNYVKASDDNFSRSSRTRTDRDGWMLSNAGYLFSDKTNSTRAKLYSQFGAVSNELLISYQTIRDRRNAKTPDVPLMLIQADVSGTYVAAGAEKFSQANELDQNVFEITNNLTIPAGNHQITLGTHNEFFSFRNLFFAGSKGVWTFANADAYDAGTPNRYERSLELRPGGGTAEFSVKQLGGYLQDRFVVNDRLTLTAGLRIDVPFSDKPVENSALTSSSLAVNTSLYPSGNLLFSPRLGFNYDVTGDGMTVLRGGAGVFSGRPPYVWMANAFTGTGKEQVTLVCTGAAVPTFTANINNLPETCANTGAPNPPTANVAFFDENFKFQQALKFSLGLDHEFGWGLVGTIDALVTRNRNSLYLSDANLNAPSTNAEGRAVYGTLSSSGSSTPSRRDAGFRTAVSHENRSKDKSFSVTGQLQKRFSDGVGFSVAYTYSQAKDLYSLTSSIATSNLNFTALDGTLADRNLAVSGFDVPHTIKITGSVNLPLDIGASLIYTGRSGFPYAYTYNGDANADGISGNDLMFVPASASDISLSVPADFATLDQFIESEPCLRDQRGQIMDRNSCRNPWVGFLDARLAKYITVPGGNRMEISADIFNLLNLMNGDWGLQRETSGFEEFNFLRVVGFDGTANRPRYDLPKSGGNIVLPSLRRVQTFGSRWKVQLGAKYNFF